MENEKKINNWNIAPSRRFRIKFGMLKSDDAEDDIWGHVEYLAQQKDPRLLENCEHCKDEECYKAEFESGWTIDFELYLSTNAILYINFYRE